MHIGKDIIQACIKGERKAQHQMYTQCFSLMMSVCHRYTRNRDDALSMVNLAFLKVLNHLKEYREDMPFEAWLRRITLNTVIDEFRRNRKHKELIELKESFTAEDEAVMIDSAEADRNIDAAQIRDFISRLPDMSARVFNLFAVDGYSHKEISGMLGMSEGTSKWHLSFARQKLKEMITASFKTIRTLIL